MRKSRFSETQIIAILKEADSGMPVKEVCRKHGISDATYYKWKSKYGGLDASELKRIKELDCLLDVCSAMHYVKKASDLWGLCECEGNPGKYVCDCKGFKGHGICSHVLAINHMLQKVNLRRLIAEMGKSRISTRPDGTGGNRKSSVPALEKARHVEEDSSDEELMALMEQGARGA